MKRNILLLEPNYKNKYPPMGLMKIATYYRCRGDNVRFYKGNLKLLAAQLLLEEYLKSVNISEFAIDNIVDNFVKRRGTANIIEYIKTGKHAPLERIAAFSRSTNELDECSLKDLLKIFTIYRNKYKHEEYPKFDRVCVTTMFTFYWKETIETIEFAKKLCTKIGNIYVGGIAASLVPECIERETGIKPHIGILSEPFIYDKDKKGDVIIDKLPLDYSILEEIDYRYPTENAYFGYMTRGCVNHCPFCSVPVLEPEYCNYIGIKPKINKIDECFGTKRDLLLMDNNVFASNCFDKIIDEIKDCGYAKGATYIPDSEYDIAYKNLRKGFKLGEGKSKNVFNDRAYFKKIINIYDKISERLEGEHRGSFYNRREELGLLYSETARKESVIALHEIAKNFYDKFFKRKELVRFIDFNQGLDGRLASDEKMEKISQLAIRPLRIAFDHWKMKDTYKKVIESAAKHGIRDLSNYLLYNLHDHPDELYERLRMNVELCDRLNIAIYSFPMKYHPIDDANFFRSRDYIGQPHWNRKFIRTIQAVLNSTHGKIGKGLTFFEAAFGKDLDEFHKILWMPEALIIQRYKYDIEKRNDFYGDNPTPYDDLDEETSTTTPSWWRKFNSLNTNQRKIIEAIIADNKFSDEDIACDDEEITDVLKYYQIRRDGC